jgi:hypothetical protein
VNILFFCNRTQNVSGALAPIIRSTGNCIDSHRYRVYTDKIEVVEGKTVKTIKIQPCTCGYHMPTWQSQTLLRWHVVPTDSRLYFYSFYSFIYNEFHLIGINTIPVAVNTVSCTPDDGWKRTRKMLSNTAEK